MEIVWQSGEKVPRRRTAAACPTCRARKKRCYHIEDRGTRRKENNHRAGRRVQRPRQGIDTSESILSPGRVSEYNPESVLVALSENAEPGISTLAQTPHLAASRPTLQALVPSPSVSCEPLRRLAWYKQHKIRSAPPPLSESYRRYLQEEGAFTALPKSATDALLPLYNSTLDDLVPIADGPAVFRHHSNGHASIYLVKAICLVVCKIEHAAPFLRLTESGPLLEPLDFASKLLAGLDAAIKADLEPDRIIKIQILALMHLHNDGLAGVDRASNHLSQAICEAWSMCIHLKTPGNPDDNECKYLWWSLRNFDRLGKPIMAAAPFFIDDADIGVERILPSKDSYRSQIMAVALRLGDLMTIATKAYKASSTTMVDGCWEFPALTEVMGGSGFDEFHMSHRAYLETWYHVAAMLSCRYNGPGTAQYTRRLESADRVLAIVSRQGCEGLPPLPLVPYAMSMSTTVIYRALHDGARDIDKARDDLDKCCDVLDGLSQRWTSVRGVAKLAKRLYRLISDGTLKGLRVAHRSTPGATTASRLPISANLSAIEDQTGDLYSDEALQRQLSEIWPSFDASYTQMDWAFHDYGFGMEFPSPFDNFSS